MTSSRTMLMRTSVEVMPAPVRRGPPWRPRRAPRRRGRSSSSRSGASGRRRSAPRRPPRGRAMPGKLRLPARKRSTATSSAAMRRPWRAGPAGRPRGRWAAPGSAPRRAASNVMRGCSRRSSRGAGRRAVRDRSGRTGWGCACRGVPAGPSASRRRTRRASGRGSGGGRRRRSVLVGHIVQPVRLDDLQALVHERRRVDGDLGAHRPGRVRQRVRGAWPSAMRSAGQSGTDRPRRSAAVAPRSPGRSPARHCQMAECSESMGRSQASGEAMGSPGSAAATAPREPRPAASRGGRRRPASPCWRWPRPCRPPAPPGPGAG